MFPHGRFSGFSLVVSLPMFQCRLAVSSDLITFSESGSHENPDVVCFSLFSLSMNVCGFVSKAQCRHVRCPQRRSARSEGVRGKVRPGNRSTEAPCPPDSAFLVFCRFFLPVSLPRAWSRLEPPIPRQYPHLMSLEVS